jgi:uncharacterized protein (DUF1330 family)
MPAYLVVEHTIADPANAKHRGRYLTKGNTPNVLETARRPPDRVMIIEFADMEALKAFYTAPEYQPLIPLRQSAVDMDKETLFALESVTGRWISN